MSSSDFRFGGIRRLYGDQDFEKIHASHILVVGLGGVGSWVVEALARSGVGALTLVDFDDVCVTNTNRQVLATTSTIGKQKTQVLRERALEINPDIQIHIFDEPFDKSTEAEIFKKDYDVVVDAIDNGLNKFELILACRERRVPIVVAGAAGGRRDPGLIARADLSQTVEDKLLSILRKKLRREAGFPRQGKMQIQCVFSKEKPIYPGPEGCVSSNKDVDFKKPLDCATGFGTISHITATFGMMLSHMALEQVVKAKH